MRLIAWNILHGGGPKRTPEIAVRLSELRPDVTVLTEFRRTTGGQIAGVLFDRGLTHQRSTDPGPGRNGVLIASRTPLETAEPGPDERFKHRWLDVHLPELGAWLTAVHAPDTRRSDACGVERQALYWQALVRLAGSRKDARMLIAGDLNTGRHRLDESGASFTGGWFLGRLWTLGFRDSYRIIEPSKRGATWTSRTGSGFRIDAVWVSAALRESVIDVRHGTDAREAGASDHAPVIADFGGVFQGFFDAVGHRKSQNPTKTGVRALAAPKVVR